MSCPRCGSEGHSKATATLSIDPSSEPTIALVGNPNVGKSTLFNQLTGARQRVVNAPGTTVQVASGTWHKAKIKVLDLPGTYSLIATSPDEQVVSDTISCGPGTIADRATTRGIDLVLVLLDGSSLTRSLYLLGQVGQTGQPVAAVVTMADVAVENGDLIDYEALSRTLGIPIMPMDPRSSKDYDRLEEMVTQAIATRPHIRGIEPDPGAPGYIGDEAACGCCEPAQAPAHKRRKNAAVSRMHAEELDRADILFSWVDDVERSFRESTADPERLSRSDKLDRLLLNPFVGLAIFFGLMWLLFKTAGEWVSPLQDRFEDFFSKTDPGAFSVANGAVWLLKKVGLDDTWFQQLTVGGIINGLGVVASFFPLMFVIYAAFSVLEDSGYMARAAFLGDRLMRKMGLDGRVILPLIMGFGCNLPSLAAVRTLPSARQRLVTVLITPYTSCAARVTIYLMIARIFFRGNVATVVFSMYLLSAVLIVLGAWVLKFFVTKDEKAAPLMLVLPAYQVPRLLIMLKMTFRRSWAFVTGAGKIIVAMTAVVWLMGAIPVGAGAGDKGFADPELAMEDSLYGKTAQVLVPIFKPTGFGEWHMTGALMTGFVAKETVISSFVTSYNLDPEADAGDAEDDGSDLGKLPKLVNKSLTESAGTGNQGLAAFAFLVFILAYTPCLATVAEQAKLIGAKKATAAVGVQLAVAWVLAVAIFQIGKLLL